MPLSVVVGIPVYKKRISYFERIALIQVDRVLLNYKKVFIAPVSLSFDYGFEYDVIKFPDRYFVSTESYSELLMSEMFYKRLSGYEFLLIYQLDAFVFGDSLKDFCSLGYDYMGAPVKSEDWKYFHVGNGGLSLRNIKKCMEVLRYKKETIGKIYEKVYEKMIPDTLPEDLFFGYCGWDSDMNFKVPSPREAVKFSVQNDYAHGMRDIEKRGLPFGCHFWWKSNYNFWKPYIEEYGYDLPTLETSNSLKSDAIRRMMYLVKRYTRKDIVFNNNSIDYAVYGGGIWGDRCVNFLKQLSLNVIKVYAQESDKSSICGVPVVKPSKKEIIRNEMFIVIGTLKYENEIKAMLIEMGLKEGEGFCTLYDFCCRAAKGCSGGIAKIINCASMK